MSSKPLYIVTDWDFHFETYESRRLVKPLTWVAMPTKHDGKGIRRLMREKDAAAIYGAWAFILQVASKMKVRGVLADYDGPLDSLDLEDKVGLPARCFDRALEFMSSERMRWLQVITDAVGIDEQIQQIRGNSRMRPARPAGAPADHPQDVRAPNGKTPQSAGAPADSPQIPADLAKSPQSAGAPADSRTLPQIPSSARVQDSRTGPDRTGHTPPTSSPGVSDSSPAGVAETIAFIVSLFGKKRSRLSSAAEYELGRVAATLPLSAGQKAMLTWFYGLPADKDDFHLSRRRGDADKLASNLFGELERAEAYAQKNPGARASTEKPAEEPPDWRDRFAKKYPRAEVPGSFWEIDERQRREFYDGEAQA